jgi:hypothetical protein
MEKEKKKTQSLGSQTNDMNMSLEFVKATRLLRRGKKAFADHEWRLMETL